MVSWLLAAGLLDLSGTLLQLLAPYAIFCRMYRFMPFHTSADLGRDSRIAFIHRDHLPSFNRDDVQDQPISLLPSGSTPISRDQGLPLTAGIKGRGGFDDPTVSPIEFRHTHGLMVIDRFKVQRHELPFCFSAAYAVLTVVVLRYRTCRALLVKTPGYLPILTARGLLSILPPGEICSPSQGADVLCWERSFTFTSRGFL